MRFKLILILLVLFCDLSTGYCTNYYCDPVTGSMANNGTFASPWSSLQNVFNANKTFVAGDTIFLRTGSHGFVTVKGVNSGNVVIMPQQGESPIIDRMKVSGAIATPAAFWKLYKLTFQSESTSGTINPSYSILELFKFCNNITVSNCTIASNFNTANWNRDDWRKKCNSGLIAYEKLNANHIIENNLITNVTLGLIVGSSNTLVKGNTVQNFTRDGSRVLGSDIVFEGNKVYDLIKVFTRNENHDDLFQAYTTANSPGQDTLKNNIISGNLFINTTDTTRAFRGSAQGIGCFDGTFYNWRLENNIVITDHWHGISLYGAENCVIINNTVIDPYAYTPIDPFDSNNTNIGPTWILIDKKTGGPNSFGNIVKNNLVANVVTFGNTAMGTGSNNIIIGSIPNYANFFVNVSTLNQPILFDLQLKSGCSAIDAGNNVSAPLKDFKGTTRPQGSNVDVGAYEFSSLTTSIKNINKPRFLLYPNPCTGQFEIKNNEINIEQIDIYNNTGLKCMSINKPMTAQIIDLHQFPNGIYFLRLETKQGTFTEKILKQ